MFKVGLGSNVDKAIAVCKKAGILFKLKDNEVLHSNISDIYVSGFAFRVDRPMILFHCFSRVRLNGAEGAHC